MNYDGFHARCIRKIVGIQHSYLSRVTNVEVLSKVSVVSLSKLLLEQQLLAFGKVFRKPSFDLLRKAIFQPMSDALVANNTNRRRGRPKLRWAIEVRKIAMVISPIQLGCDMGHANIWKRKVRLFCRGDNND